MEGFCPFYCYCKKGKIGQWRSGWWACEKPLLCLTFPLVQTLDHTMFSFAPLENFKGQCRFLAGDRLRQENFHSQSLFQVGSLKKVSFKHLHFFRADQGKTGGKTSTFYSNRGQNWLHDCCEETAWGQPSFSVSLKKLTLGCSCSTTPIQTSLTFVKMPSGNVTALSSMWAITSSTV